MEVETAFPQTPNLYDAWSLDSAGKFVLIDSLFEDHNAPGKKLLYLDTRIRRTAEAIIRTGSLYRQLQVPLTTTVEIEIEYGGLQGRSLQVSQGSGLTPILGLYICNSPTFKFNFSDSIDNLWTDTANVFAIIRGLTMMFNNFNPPQQTLEHCYSLVKGRP